MVRCVIIMCPAISWLLPLLSLDVKIVMKMTRCKQPRLQIQGGPGQGETDQSDTDGEEESRLIDGVTEHTLINH